MLRILIDLASQLIHLYTSITATYETIDIRNNPMGPEYMHVYARVDEAVRITSEQ